MGLLQEGNCVDGIMRERKAGQYRVRCLWTDCRASIIVGIKGHTAKVTTSERLPQEIEANALRGTEQCLHDGGAGATLSNEKRGCIGHGGAESDNSLAALRADEDIR